VRRRRFFWLGALTLVLLLVLAYLVRDRFQLVPVSSDVKDLTAVPTVVLPVGPRFYVSPSGSSAGDGSVGSPWDLQTALSQPAAVVPGSTVWLRGGTYVGKFASVLRGTPALPVVVRSYPGEWARIEGFKTTTLAAPIGAGAGEVLTLADASGFADGSVAVVDGEHIRLGARTGNSFVAIRGWDGTAPAAHAAGALAVLGGDALVVGGSDAVYMDFEVLNSDPVRTDPVFNTQDAPRLRGECVWHDGPRTRLVNLVVHDCQDGVFSTIGAVGGEVYGLVIYNNGYLAGGQANGHGMYVANTAGEKRIVDTIAFNNFNNGFKEVSQTGNAVGLHNEGVVGFNNGAPLAGASTNVEANARMAGLLVGADGGISDRVTVTNSFFYIPTGYIGTPLRLGYVAANGSINVTGNYIAGGGTGVDMKNWGRATVTGNTFYANPGTDWAVLLQRPAGSAYVWDGGTIYDQSRVRNCAGGGRRAPFNYNGVAGPCGGSLDFDGWRAASGLDGGTAYRAAPAPTAVFVRPNRYQAGRANVVVANWAGLGAASVDLSGVGLAAGQAFEVREVQDYFGPPAYAGVYNGAPVSVPLTGGAAAAPVGVPPPRSTCPEFCVFVILPR
jgi:hypothetical protein